MRQAIDNTSCLLAFGRGSHSQWRREPRPSSRKKLIIYMVTRFIHLEASDYPLHLQEGIFLVSKKVRRCLCLFCCGMLLFGNMQDFLWLTLCCRKEKEHFCLKQCFHWHTFVISIGSLNLDSLLIKESRIASYKLNRCQQVLAHRLIINLNFLQICLHN